MNELTAEEQYILIEQKGEERPFSGEYYNLNDEWNKYAGDGNELVEVVELGEDVEVVGSTAS